MLIKTKEQQEADKIINNPAYIRSVEKELFELANENAFQISQGSTGLSDLKMQRMNHLQAVYSGFIV